MRMPFPINTFGIVEGGGQTTDKKTDDVIASGSAVGDNKRDDDDNAVTVLPFSMRVMRCVVGNCCANCSPKDPVKEEEERKAEEKEIEKLLGLQEMAYCMPLSEDTDEDFPVGRTLALAKRNCGSIPSSYLLSPAVYNPVLATTTYPELQQVQLPIIERILADYRTACAFYQRPMNAGVMTTLRFSVPYLRVTPDFIDADMLALSEILIRYANGPLRFITRLDFAKRRLRGLNNAGFGSHGALALAKILQSAEAVTEVFVERNRVGAYGATALFLAARNVKVLRMRRCRLGERGALAFAAHVEKHMPLLRSVDLSANYVGYSGCLAVEQSILALNGNDRAKITVDLEGNVSGKGGMIVSFG